MIKFIEFSLCHLQLLFFFVPFGLLAAASQIFGNLVLSLPLITLLRELHVVLVKVGFE
jgi:hypothetical protein